MTDLENKFEHYMECCNPDGMENKLYRHSDIDELIALDKIGSYYTKHLSAMTKEGLHNKADIAAELAYRDYVIDKLKTTVPYSAVKLLCEMFDNPKFMYAWLDELKLAGYTVTGKPND